MRQFTRKGLITAAAVSGVLAVSGGYAQADSGASGSVSNSPGVLSGNSVQVPVHIPVNVCGNTVNVLGVLNPAMGNSCAGAAHDDGPGQPGGSSAGAHTGDSPGVGSGNHVEVPVDVPVNVCGNAVTIGGLGDAAVGNDCGGGHHQPGHENPPSHPGDPGNPNDPGTPQNPDEPGHPGGPGQPESPAAPVGQHSNQPVAQSMTLPQARQSLADTGSPLPVGAALSLSAGALLGGAVLYRRTRSAT